jgi:hypothetical protein
MKAISLVKAHVEEALDLVLSLPPSPLLRPDLLPFSLRATATATSGAFGLNQASFLSMESELLVNNAYDQYS